MVSGAEIAGGLLRVAIGPTMIAHGVRHGRTHEGTARWFESVGFRRPRLQAGLSSVVEIGAGTAVLAGAATPLAASAVIGTMAVAGHAVHRPNGFFVVSDGYEYVLTLGVGAAALAALGSGRWSVDHLLGLDGVLNAPVRTAIAVAAGLAGAAAQLRLYWSAPERSR